MVCRPKLCATCKLFIPKAYNPRAQLQAQPVLITLSGPAKVPVPVAGTALIVAVAAGTRALITIIMAAN